MIWRIEIFEREGIFDSTGESVRRDITDLGIKGVRSVRFIQVYNIENDLEQDEAERIARELLCDHITQRYNISPRTAPALPTAHPNNIHTIEVAYNPGVMDPTEASALKALADLGFDLISSVKTSKKYIIEGRLSAHELNIICNKLLANPLIQHVVKAQDATAHLAPREAGYEFKLITLDILDADDERLMKISRDGQLSLNVDEMRAIRGYFARHRRNPTDAELETLAQTWSEHCSHKTLKGIIEYKEQNSKFRTQIINNLLKSTIMKATKELNKPWCVSVFKDNAGIIRFDEKYNVCFKVETHNHPSALEPYGGAGTGIGGVIRDILGCGLGGAPILNTDVFCFGSPDTPFDKLPKGVLHPKRIAKGVVRGVRDYGNRMGIPTSSGAVLFDEGYIANPLVYCGTVGIMPRDKCKKEVRPGHMIVLAGGKTGRDGIHGATFSSAELTSSSEVVSSGAVQIGNPIEEKKLLDTIIKARDEALYSSITDCGAGGLSSAVGEMGASCGAKVYLERIPLKYNGLSYTEIWISESQERMVLSCHRENLEALLKIFRDEDVEATVIGEFTNTGRLELFYDGCQVANLNMRFLHKGIPKQKRKAEWKAPMHREPTFPSPKNLTPYLKDILSNYTVASKEWVIRQYDHEVQGRSVLKPLVGKDSDGPSDACIIRPILNSRRGLIISCGINPRYALIDPYWMAASCIDEALRQIIAAGGSLEQVALLDNFCWGNTDKADRLGGLVRAARGCYDIATGYGAPFISGKDSLNNEYYSRGKSLPIPGTLLISAAAVMDDARYAISMDLKEPGNLIYIVGATYDELGGSQYYLARGRSIGSNVPKVNTSLGRKIMTRLAKAARIKTVSSCHDLSEGGLGVAAAEMAFAGDVGMRIWLERVRYEAKSETRHRDDFILFSESNTRFLVEVRPRDKGRFENLLRGAPLACIGETIKEKNFEVIGLKGGLAVKAKLAELKEAWRSPLRW